MGGMFRKRAVLLVQVKENHGSHRGTGEDGAGFRSVIRQNLARSWIQRKKEREESKISLSLSHEKGTGVVPGERGKCRRGKMRQST